MANKKLFLLLQAFLNALLIYCFTCIAEGKVIFFESIVSSKDLPEYLRLIKSLCLALIVLVAILTVLDKFLFAKNVRDGIYDSFCKALFDILVKKEASLQNSDFKITLFQVSKPWFMGRMLKRVGRAQSKSSYKKTKVTFKQNEGCAGLAWSINRHVHKEINKFDPNNVNAYIQDSLEKFSLPKKKVDKLNEKACAFLCSPVRYNNTDDVWGVISIDCMKKQKLKDIDTQKIEDLTNIFSTLFDKQ